MTTVSTWLELAQIGHGCWKQYIVIELCENGSPELVKLTWATDQIAKSILIRVEYSSWAAKMEELLKAISIKFF